MTNTWLVNRSLICSQSKTSQGRRYVLLRQLNGDAARSLGAGHRIFDSLKRADGQHERRLAHRFSAEDVVFAVGLRPEGYLEVFGDVTVGRDL